MFDALLFFICLGLPVLWGVWRVQRRRVAEETRRTVMASVMDAQNNLLNNLVYFRTRAEADGTMADSDLVQMDCAIRDTQERLIEIANAGLQDQRNLGGIRVLSRSRVGFTG